MRKHRATPTSSASSLGPIERPRPVARWQSFTGQEAVPDGALN